MSLSSEAGGYGGSTPVPDIDTLSGVAVALVAMVSFADLLAAVFGVNVTSISQDSPGARSPRQLLISAHHDA